MFRAPFTTRPPQRFDWAGGTRGFVAIVIAAVTTLAEIGTLLLVPTGSMLSIALVWLCVLLLVPASAFASAFGGAWRGPARGWGILCGIVIALPPLGVMAALLPISVFYLLFVLSVGFIGHIIGRRTPPSRRFD